MSTNELIHAVAGGGKTTHVIERCAEAGAATRVLALTYTTANQDILRRRLVGHVTDLSHVTVMGWFQFLIARWVRPYVPHKFENRRVRGFNFDADPGRYARNESRFFDSSSKVYKRTLARLAHEVNAAAHAEPVGWLERNYDLIVIDEVQDLNGWDLEILDLLLDSTVPLLLVGDTRQAIVLTNPQDQKNSNFKYRAVIDWFREREKKGRLSITEQVETWRCRAEIAEFADSIFGTESGFSPSVAKNDKTTGHDGVFIVHPDHVDAYVTAYAPAALRPTANDGKKYSLDYSNCGEVKGLEYDHVLIAPTKGFAAFVQGGTEPLNDLTAGRYYVGVTRARQSVGVILDDASKSPLPVWTPPTP